MSVQKRLAALGAIVVFAGATVLSGCGDASDKVAEKVAESQTDGKVKIDSDDGSVEYTDEDGNKTQFNTGGGASLPDDWPEALAPPDGVNIISSSTSTVDGKRSMVVFADAEGTVSDFFEGIKTQITSVGYAIDQEGSTDATGGSYATLTASDSSSSILVSISDDSSDSGKVDITFTVTEK